MSLTNIENNSLRDQIVGPTGAQGIQGVTGPVGPTGPEGTIPATIAVDVINPLANPYVEMIASNGLRIGPNAIISSNNIPANSIDWNGANGLTADAIMAFDGGLTTDAINNNNMVDMEIVNGNANINLKVPVANVFNFKVGGVDKLEIDNTDTTILTDLIVNVIENRTGPDISINNINMRDDQICFSSGFCIDDELSTANAVTLQFAPNDMLVYRKDSNKMEFSVGGGPLNPDVIFSGTEAEFRVPIDQTTASALVLGPTNATSINVTPPLKVDQIDELTGSNSVVMTNGIKLGAGADILDTYIEDTQANTFSGPWALAQAVTLKFTKIGNVITMSWSNVLATSNASAIITLDTNLPVAYRPVEAGNGVGRYIRVRDDGTFGIGEIFIESTGLTRIWLGTSISNFTGGGGSTGLTSGSITYS